MKFCTNCGKQLEDNAAFCIECGTPQGVAATPQEQPAPVAPQPTYQQAPQAQAPADGSSFGYALLGFCIPIVGLILFLVWKDSTPLRAKSAGKGALISVIVSAVCYVLYAILIGAMMLA